MTAATYDFAEAARKIGCSETWLRRNSVRLPRQKCGRDVRFSESDCARIQEMHHLEPQAASQPTAIGPKGAPALSSLKPLPSRTSA
ncbi:helix-turn-helix domain-containing protein [Streptomyces sp. Z26]|uniref:helix-turn-helix domain-containing protein n=1 Tax=Streptomyces sp. Z26 TaxID=2500177 RepID=UPI000EF13649|nr:helix-turn-helix domain-containing protein [Streptomyces sp. Z26]RLL66959.1 DNA-binding protein [Streptomyces sp. Z26]